jgi:hypothetical protein
LLVGLTLAPADIRTMWDMIRDNIAGAIDAALRFASDAS